MKPSKKKSQRKPLPRVLVIVGPTASGKTGLGIKLARKFNGEIVSADSRQVYRGLDIGTAKPTRAEQKIAPHHLVDIRNPNQPYTVAQYKRASLKAIRDILGRKKLPIIVGGTGLYIKALVNNLTIPQMKADPRLRAKLEKRLRAKGINHLYRQLINLDPEAAYIIDPHNPRRLIRALEIILSSKELFSATRRQGKPLFNFLQIGIRQTPKKLRERIDRRIDEMIKAGLIEEVRRLTKKYPASLSAFEAIGYREIIDHLQGRTSLEDAVELAKKNTWQFAKRQMTWFRKDKRIHWITTPTQAKKLVKEFLKLPYN